MASYKADSRREEFRKYLEKAGVMDVLTKVLVGLFEEPEKPSDGLEYLKRFLGAGGPEAADVEVMKSELTELQQKVEKLNEENSDLKRKITELEQQQQQQQQQQQPQPSQEQQPQPQPQQLPEEPPATEMATEN